MKVVQRSEFRGDMTTMTRNTKRGTRNYERKSCASFSSSFSSSTA